MTDRPNLLFILTDQQSASMLSAAGNPHLRTPAMDRLAGAGARFDRAYCSNPLCVPSRFSLMTGRLPSAIGLRGNDCSDLDRVPPAVQRASAGWLLRAAGYETAYGGKVHLPNLAPADLGFECICEDERDELATACAAFVMAKRDRPFFLVASFVNPHDICYMAIRDCPALLTARRLANSQTALDTVGRALELPAGMSRDTFFETRCPPLPANHEPQRDEPEAVRWLLEQAPFRAWARANYTAERWRLHRWAYARLTELVDAQIGRVLDALRASGQEENTIVVLSSDHGDMDASHRLEHKTVLYEEACRVPLLVSGPGVAPGAVIPTLVSNGLDLVPTLCDYAGIEPPADVTGVSFRPLAEGTARPATRPFVPVEGLNGRMIVADQYKYVRYDDGAHREQFVDLRGDPGETANGINDPANATALRQLREFDARQFGGGGAAAA